MGGRGKSLFVMFVLWARIGFPLLRKSPINILTKSVRVCVSALYVFAESESESETDSEQNQQHQQGMK